MFQHILTALSPNNIFHSVITNKKLLNYFLIGYFILAFLTIYFFNGTGDSGDSIHHYLFAKYAPTHPYLFFDHWAKPLFVLLAAPFAQFGFIGVKVFNVLLTGFSMYLMVKSAKIMQLKNSLLIFIFILFSPLCYILTFSGLTEPLFAFIISLSLFFINKKHFILASFLLSFLPFIRSEGLIIIAIFGVFFIYKKHWKALLILGFGHLFYSIAGWPFTNDLLWVFNKIPYAHLSSVYGSGSIFHFTTQLFYVIGAPLYILFVIGFIKISVNAVQKKITSEIFIIVYVGAGAFIIAHSLFWYLGIFNSMGLKRVLIAIIPLISIIALEGYNFITSVIRVNKSWNWMLHAIIIGLILVFPFTSNPAAINFKQDLMLTEDQILVQKLSKYVLDIREQENCIIHSNPYLSETLSLDHFDQKQRLEFTREYMKFSKSGDIFIWDNWFAVVEHGVLEENLNKNTELIHLKDFQTNDSKRDIRYVIFQRK